MEKVLRKRSTEGSALNNSIYSRPPLYFDGSIPVFSRRNEFVKNYEKVAQDHIDAISDTCNNPWIEEESWRIMEASTLELILRWSRPGDRILDVGVGLGRLLKMLPEHERYGMDIALPYLEISKKKGITVCMAMIEDIPYHRDFFDIIICTDVLEHVLDFNLSITNILSVLRLGGVLIVRVPYKESLESYTKASYPYYYAHLRNFDEHSLVLQLTRCFGCEVLDVSYSLYLPQTERFKYRLPTKYSTKIQRGILKIIKSFFPKIFQVNLARMMEPVVINMVFRNRCLGNS